MWQRTTRANQSPNGRALGRAAVLLLAAMASCRSSTGPEPSPDVGVIDFYTQEPTGVIEAPASVRAGQDFTVTVRTFGGGCVSAAGASVTYHRAAPELAVVVPYDNARVPPGTMCTEALTRPARDLTLRFVTPGSATIRVEGRRQPEGGRAVVAVAVAVTPS